MVPFDFTPAAQKALDYALHLGKNVHTEIKLIHLAKNKKVGGGIKAKLEEIKSKASVPAGVKISTFVRVGNIFTDISKIAKEEKAQLVIMGTHGKNGLQKLFGSNAMKVITSADCPFLIVQKNTEIKEVKRLAVPIDLTKESLQIVNLAGDIATMYGAHIHVLAEKQTDQILNTRLKNRISIVTKQYEEREVKASIDILKKRGGYRKKVMNFAKLNKVDMIALS
ncbi:MAG: nucleotide-binding universal stress UspA family protein, partial [Crocinitomicaceae bacterium]